MTNEIYFCSVYCLFKIYVTFFHFKIISQNRFLAEAKLEKTDSLAELNHLYQVWFTECYQHKPHSALKDQRSPYEAFQSGKHPIRYLAPQAIHDAFLHREERKVDKTGCISFQGKPYEVGLQFLGMKVTVIYDPADISTIQVQAGDLPTVQAKERIIGAWSGSRPKLPEHLTALQRFSFFKKASHKPSFLVFRK